jgi:hypothetical protein
MGLLLVSCSGLKKIAVGSTASILYDASVEIETEDNWEHFSKAVPGNLKLIEGMHSVNPSDEQLLVTLIKGYAGYAFIVPETYYLNDFYAENDDETNLKQALYHYSRSFKYGLNFLELQGLTYKDLTKALKEKGGIPRLLDNHLDEEKLHLEAILFMGQSLGQMVNFQRTRMSMVAQLPVVKGLFDWVCAKKPDMNFGACQIFYGAYEAGRPRTMGGNPEKGKKIFLKMIEDNPANWLARVAYMQFYLIPLLDEKGYKQQKFFMETAKRKHYQELTWSPVRKPDVDFKEKRLRLYQALAIKRFEIMQKFEKEIF